MFAWPPPLPPARRLHCNRRPLGRNGSSPHPAQANHLSDMRFLLLAVTAISAANAEPTNQLRTDGIPVVKVPHLRSAFAAAAERDFPFKRFSAAAVAAAKSAPLNWTAKGAVTPVKDQGPHGYCGTFGRVAAAEGQFALRSGAGRAVQFSEEALVDCIGWDQVPQQQTFFQKNGFMTTAAYP